MSNYKLWTPSTTDSILNEFIKSLDKDLNIKNYEDLHKWSVNKKNDFWENVWDFTNIKGQKKGKGYIDSNEFLNAKFFNQSKLNYAENCLIKNDDSDAIIFYNEQKICRRYSWKELREKVYKLSQYFILKKMYMMILKDFQMRMVKSILDNMY